MRNTATFALFAAAILACTSPPQVSAPPPYPLALGGVHVNVVRSEHYAAVVEGLRIAGVPIAESPDELHYILKVDIGKAKTGRQSCGIIRNVRYTVNYAVVPQRRVKGTEVWSGRPVAVGGQALQIVASGYDGNCATNVFNQMGAALRQQMIADYLH